MSSLRLTSSLAALGLLNLAGCFSSTEPATSAPPAEPTTRPFVKPAVAAFAGEYRLTEQHVVDTLSLRRLAASRLVLRADYSFHFTAYPCFTNYPGTGWKLDSLADFTGTWRLKQSTLAFNEATQKRELAWGCQFDPEPGPRYRSADEQSRTRLWVDPAMSRTSGRLRYLYFYIGDPDSGDYLRYEPVAAR